MNRERTERGRREEVTGSGHYRHGATGGRSGGKVRRGTGFERTGDIPISRGKLACFASFACLLVRLPRYRRPKADPRYIKLHRNHIISYDY